jgi:pentatricopeptide repeat protein
MESRRANTIGLNKDVWSVATNDPELVDEAASSLHSDPSFSKTITERGRPIGALSIPNSIGKGKEESVPALKSWPPRVTPGSNLEQMVRDPNGDVDKTWKYFVEQFGTGGGTALSRTTLSDRIRVKRGEMFKQLLEQVITKWCRDTTGSLPMPAGAIEIFELAAIMKPEYYLQSLWILIRALMKARISDGADLDSAAKKAIEHQLMIIWSRIFQLFCKKTGLLNYDAKPLAVDWSHLPQISGEKFFNDRTSGYTVGSMTMRLGRVLSRFAKEHHHHLAGAVLATFVLFGPQKHASSGLLEMESPEYKPLMLVFSSILYRTDISRSAQLVENILTEESVGKVGQFLQSSAGFIDSLQNAPFMAVLMLSTESNKSVSESNSGPDVARHSLESHFTNLLGRIDEKARYGDLEIVWANAKSAFALLDKGSQAAMPPKLYHLFIRASYKSGNPAAAIEVWNEMVTSGIKPSVSQWTEMIMGAGRQRDVDAVERLWHRMLDAGIVPDAQARTVRIRAIMQCGRIKKGLRMLEDWSKEWVAAAEAYMTAKNVDIPLARMTNMVGGIPKPTVLTLNSILATLVHRKEHAQIQQLLGWASSIGIPPNVYTFNKLMNMHLEDSCVTEALLILNQMPAQGVEPDVATFTILIDGIYRSQAGAEMTPEQQIKFATEVLETMESRSTEANLVTFGALINGLLKHGNVDAAKSVLLYMQDRGKSCSPQVHTVLMRYFFNQDVPDIASITDLWHKVNTADLKADSLFFNTMVQGFASAEEFDLTLNFLAKMSKNGMDPTWTTLSTALRALLNAGQRDKAQAIVDGAANAMARGSMGIGSGGMNGTSERQRDAFWALADSVGLQANSLYIHKKDIYLK